MYYEGENPLFEMWTQDRGGGGPFLWEQDAYVYDRGWSAANVRFLHEFLTTERVVQTVRNAAKRLETEAEAEVAPLFPRNSLYHLLDFLRVYPSFDISGDN